MDFQRQQHDQRQSTDSVVRTMLKESILGKCAFLHQINGDGTYEKRADAQAKHDDDNVVGNSKCTNDAVEREGCVQYFEVKERASTTARYSFSIASQIIAHHVYHHVGHDAGHTSNKDLSSDFIRRDSIDEKYGSHRDSGDQIVHIAIFGHARFQPMHPVYVFLAVKEIRQKHHQEKDTTERRYFGTMRG